jgi:hypothetical protein
METLTSITEYKKDQKPHLAKIMSEIFYAR